MGRILQCLQDVFYISTVRLGGANFNDMQYGAEEWKVSCLGFSFASKADEQCN